jgi:hypothetical protein
VGTVVNDSSIRSQRMNVFSKSIRFTSIKNQSPGPQDYSPTAGLLDSKDAALKRAPTIKFNQDRTSPCDLEFHMKRAKLNPGPGSYRHQSSFCSDAD